MRSLQRRAETITNAFNSCENITCQPCQGAMYSFPCLHLPPKAIAAAKEAGVAPDVFYCLALLDATGISSTPGETYKPTICFAIECILRPCYHTLTLSTFCSQVLALPESLLLPFLNWYFRHEPSRSVLLIAAGSAFGQKPGSFHLRVTILPPEDAITKMMADFVAFHKQFMDQYCPDASSRM